MVQRVFVRSLLAVAVFLSFSTASASAANFLVDDNKAECPAAGYTKIQDAVDAATDGDTVVICEGDYVEGNGATGSSSVSITKSIDLKGAGADLVSIMPRRNPSIGGRIASGTPILRDVYGNVISIKAGTPDVPGEVNISGVSVEGNGVFVETGIIFLDTEGSVVRSRVTDIVTSEAAGAFGVPGGYRNSNTGYGIVQASTATTPPASGAVPRPLLIETSRVDKYNKTGILIDGATNDTPPLVSAGVANQAEIIGTTVVGRLRCIDFNVNGNCSSPATINTGPIFGQDGIKVTAGASLVMDSSSIFQNFVNGDLAPVFSTITSPTTTIPGSYNLNSTNNANLSMAAGVRLIGAGASTISRSNIADNHYGAFNVELDGSTANTTTPLLAENNWWGLKTSVPRPATQPPGQPIDPTYLYNYGPAVSPTTNPLEQENPVNGAVTSDSSCVASSFAPSPTADIEVPGSDAVDFCPYRNGARSDDKTGQVAITDAPIPISDASPAISLAFDKATYERGDTAVLTASPSDDFAVKKVTFYKGADVIGTADVPPYATDVEVPADAACGTSGYSAVVEDSIGQTESATAEFSVDNCEPPAGPAPTISIVVPAETPSSGSTASASVIASEGVESVTFFIGTRKLCTDTVAPYTCAILPTGADVGGQTIRAVVTDLLDRSAEASNNTYVQKFTSKLTTNIRKVGARKRAIYGKVILPARVTAGQGCSSGTVTLKIRGGGRPTLNRQVKLSSTCRYKTKIAVGKPPKTKKGKPKKRKFAVSANFSGNSVLKPAKNTRRFF